MPAVLSAALRLAEEAAASLKQSLLGLAADVTGVLAGLVVALNISVLEPMRWALVAYPAVLAVRGLTNGILCAKLSTSLHVGSISTSLLRNTEEFYALISSLAFFNFAVSLTASVAVCAVSAAAFGASVADLLHILLCVVDSMAISFTVTAPLSFVVASRAYLMGLDPDYVTYPVMSTLADVVVSACYLLVVRLHSARETLLLLLIFAGAAAASIASLAKFSGHETFRGVLRESAASFVIVSALSSLAGAALRGIGDVIGEYRPLYVVYPAVIDTVGDVGSIVGSTYTTKLALGELGADARGIAKSLPVVVGSWASSLLVFASLPLLSAALTGCTLAECLSLLKVLLISNAVAVPVVALAAMAVATAAYRRGLDPDSFVNPIGSSLADAVASYALLLSLASAGKL
ncbi:MAG: hypothetical protein DRJ56_08075 [Thermoprotei archaeon]|nr:MAG: hypothetical protein DRJ56_08075 [Thermoprotei archaeon]